MDDLNAYVSSISKDDRSKSRLEHQLIIAGRKGLDAHLPSDNAPVQTIDHHGLK